MSEPVTPPLPTFPPQRSPQAASALPPRVQAYLDAIVQQCGGEGHALVSLIVFGSAAIGGFAEGVSDVDLFLVVRDDTDAAAQDALRREVERIELLHGMRDDAHTPRGALDAFAATITANVRTFFICTRGDLLSGDVARILGIPRGQAIFVDRVVVPSLIGSSMTYWGEDLLGDVPVAPIRRFDVLKAYFAFVNQLLLTAAVFPLVPAATKYAMDALKRSVHHCYYCHQRRRAPLDEEIAFLQQHLGHDAALAELLLLRRDYRRSFRFVARCLPALTRMHLRTATRAFPASGRPASLLLLLALNTAACAADDAAPQAGTATQIASAEELDAATFRPRLAGARLQHGPALESLSQQVLYLLDGDGETQRLSLEVRKNAAEQPDSATVEVWRDGFLDDSVRGDWHEFSFASRNGDWQLLAVRRAWRCWRRADGFQAEPCP